MGWDRRNFAQIRPVYAMMNPGALAMGKGNAPSVHPAKPVLCLCNAPGPLYFLRVRIQQNNDPTQ
jgi:hypothetical protein